MESTVVQKPKRVLKKVKDFENVHDYFNYATTEFGNENIQFAGYKWTADDLFDLYLAGDKEAVLKLALPETTDFSDLPFIKSNYDKPDRPPLKGKFTAEDTVKFPCRPAQECVEKYFEAKEWDHKLMEHPRFMNLWPNRHIDLEFAKVQLMDAKQNLAVTKQKYEESLAEMEKDKEKLKEKADKLREFTITFNNLAFRNIYKRVESEKKINEDMELNFKKLHEGKKMMKNIEKMIVAEEDLKVRIEKMQIYEDFLTRVVESSAGKYNNIQQILNRYDSVAFTKRQIVRNHMEDMFKLDVLQEKLRRYISERQDIVRNYNNQIGNLARRYKFVQKRYFHWENAVQRMKKLCNRERAQTQSVEASIWNLYVQMCVRKKMPVKEKKGDYKTQLAYILITIKQYEKIVQVAEDKYKLYLRSRTNSSMSLRKEGDKKEEIPIETETSFWIKKSVGIQTRDVNLVDASTMIWWEEEVQMTTSAIPPSPKDIEEEKPLEVENSEIQVSSTVEEEKKLTDQTTLVEEPELSKQIKPSSNPQQIKPLKLSKSTKESKVRLSIERKTLRRKQEQTQMIQEKKKSSRDSERIKRIDTSKQSKSSKQMDTLEKPEGQRLDKMELEDGQSELITNTVKESIISEPYEEKPLLDLDIDTGIAIQTDEIDTQDKSHQYELFVSAHCQTLTDEELKELQEIQQQMEAEKKILEADEQEIDWLKQATKLNIKLIRPLRKKITQVRTRETKSSFVKLESADSIHSGESIKSRGLEEWNDSAASWFYPQEWGESLEWADDDDEEEDVEVQQEFRKESPDFILGTGRRTSAAMKELSIVMYPSQRKDSVLSYTAPVQAKDQRESTAGRDSLRELEPPMWGESVVDGILRRLQEALANKGERIDGGQDRRESVWTEQTKSEEQKPSMEKEEIITTKRYEKEEIGLGRKSEIKPKEKQVPDYRQTYLKDINLVDAWTQTPYEQTEDWVQTLPVKVQYGWSQTEKIDQITQTDLVDAQKVKKISMSVEYIEVSTQTDVSPEKKKPVGKTTVDEVEPEEEEELKSSETRKLSVQLKSLGRSTTELETAESVEEKTSLKRTQLSAKAPGSALQDPSLPKSPGSRKKSSKTSAKLTKVETSVESDETLVSKPSGAKSLKPLKSTTKKKSFTGVKSTTAVQKNMMTMKEAVSSLTSDQEGTTLKTSTLKRSKELPKLSLKKTPSKPLVDVEISTKTTFQPLGAVPKITRPCKQAVQKSVSLDKISTDVKKEDKRCLHKLKMMSKSKIRVAWSRPKPDTSSKSLLPDIFTEMSSLSSSSSSTITKPLKKSIRKENFQLDDLIDRLSKSSLDTQEEFPLLSSLEEKQWSYASSTSSVDLRKTALEET